MSRPVPCCRCLDNMSKWAGGPVVVCEDTATASAKCSRCKGLNKGCYGPTGPLKARGIKLARLLVGAVKLTDAIKASQLSVRRALQAKKNRSAMSAEKATAADTEAAIEPRERKLLALERLATAAETNAAAAKQQGESLRAIEEHLSLLKDAFHKVHHAALEAPDSDYDDDNNNNNGDEVDE